MARWLVDAWEQGEVNHKGAVVIGCDECVFAEGVWNVLTVELGVEFLVEVDAVGCDFQGIDGPCLVDVVEGVVVEELA